MTVYLLLIKNQLEILSADDYRKSSEIPKKEHGLIKDKEGSIGTRIVYGKILIQRKSDD